jgi:SAM-dependent methyltransferase
VTHDDHLDLIARIYHPRYRELFASLDRSLEPRGPELMHEIASRYLRPGARVLDAGCRDAAHLIRLVEDERATGVGVDLVSWHIERARAAVEAARLQGRVQIIRGDLHALGFAAHRFDLVWCRDVFPLLDDLEGAVAELSRVTKPGGHAVVYTDLLTDLIEPAETERLNGPLGNVTLSMRRDHVEQAFDTSNLLVERVELIATEWLEYAEERVGSTSRALLRLARLRRQRESILASNGEDVYDTAEASLQWLSYQFLGKVEPVVYVLTKPG